MDPLRPDGPFTLPIAGDRSPSPTLPDLYPVLGRRPDGTLILDYSYSDSRDPELGLPPSPVPSERFASFIDHFYREVPDGATASPYLIEKCVEPAGTVPSAIETVDTEGLPDIPSYARMPGPVPSSKEDELPLRRAAEQVAPFLLHSREASPPLTRRPPPYIVLAELRGDDGLWHSRGWHAPEAPPPANAPAYCGASRVRLGTDAEQAGRVFTDARPFAWDGDWMNKLIVSIGVVVHASWLIKRKTRFAKRRAARAWRVLSGHSRIVPEDYLDPALEQDEDFGFLVKEDAMNSRPSRSIKLDLSAPGSNLAPTPIAIEPRANYKVGLVTVAMRLPTGGKPHTPNGTSGLALGSALVHLTPAQEAHLRTSDDGDARPKRNEKLSRFFHFVGRGSPQ